MSASPNPLSELEAHLGYWLRRVSNHVSGAFARRLQARQTSVAEWVALRHLWDQPAPITSGALAERMGMTRGAISKVIDKLEGKGWVVRSTDPKDGRAQWLTLTPEGERILPELAQLADRNDQEFFGCLNAGEQAMLRKLLAKLTDVHGLDTSPID